jgi:hypothetical protein
MAGYIFKTFSHSAPAAGATTVVFTVPAGKIYLIKNAVYTGLRTAATASNVQLEKSDNAGANFRPITNTLDLLAVNGETTGYNFCKGASSSRNVSNAASRTPTDNLDNMVFEAGSVLRIIIGASVTSALEVGGVEYTI